MPKSALLCSLLAGVLAATAVAFERHGLALACALLLALAAGELASATGRSCRWMLGLASALAVQPVLRDAGWVVALAGSAALLGGAAAAASPGTWRAVARAAVAPWRLLAGSAVVGRALTGLLPDGPERHVRPVARGLVLGALLTGGFGWLFAAADYAFAELAGDALAVDADPFELTWRAILGLAFAAAAGALARAGRPPVLGPAKAPRVPGRLELRIALGALAALFTTFVAVQLRVLFGGAAYVQATTGLGYGEYARQGFVALLAVTALTLAVVAVAARREDRVVRTLLGLLCGLAFVVLASAHHRLVLVEDAYGFTRLRYGGHAVVLWLGAILALVLAAGARRRIARAAPRIAVGVTLAGVLAFSLADPDRRIAERAVDRFAKKGRIDAHYMSHLSADALPALERLPEGPQRREILGEIRSELRWRDGREGRELREPDGLAGFNLSPPPRAMIARAIAVGTVLGALSRVEEVTAGLSAGLSSDSAWVGTAFVIGALAAGLWRAMLLATGAMCAANGGYYAWIAITEPGTPLASAAGDPWAWVAAGVLTGVVFGAAGRLWRVSPPRGRLAAVAPLALVLAIEGGDALRGGAATDAIGLALALVLPAASAPACRRSALAAAVGLAALAASGLGASLLP